jgi:hypothetical protein
MRKYGVTYEALVAADPKLEAELDAIKADWQAGSKSEVAKSALQFKLENRLGKPLWARVTDEVGRQNPVPPGRDPGLYWTEVLDGLFGRGGSRVSELPLYGWGAWEVAFVWVTGYEPYSAQAVA